MRARAAAALLALVPALGAPAAAPAQERGAAALVQAVDALGVTTRVLMIGAHPDDEDTNLIAALARGRQVETAYLSLTRGDGGQNLIGDELGEALGAIRTEELLAARRVDGGVQYFTRAYDFGFSKDAEETYAHWPKDSILGDVVRVVRAFRPHVIVAVFSGTPRDGHGHHQVSGLLAREAYDVAGDTARFPVLAHGTAWTPAKFYRARRGNAEGATVGMNAGEYDPVRGRSPAEIAGESRSQHKSQGFGALERKGTVMTYVLREASRVGPADASAERSLFDGLDTTLADIAGDRATGAARAHLDSLGAAIARARATLDLRHPASVHPALRDIGRHATATCAAAPFLCAETMRRRELANGMSLRAEPVSPEFLVAMGQLTQAHRDAVVASSGVAVDALVERELVIAGQPAPVLVRVYNRGSRPIRLRQAMIAEPAESDAQPLLPVDSVPDPALVPPGAHRDLAGLVRLDSVSRPWWLEDGRDGDVFAAPILRDGYAPRADVGPYAWIAFEVDGAPQPPAPSGVASEQLVGIVSEPIVHRYADPVRGEVRRPLAAVPALSVTMERPLTILPANADVRREVRVTLRSADSVSRTATVRLQLPPGLAADSLARTVTLPGYDARTTATFAVAGRMAPGRDTIRATVESGGETFATGYQLVDYEHVRPQRLYRPSVQAVQAVAVTIPAGLRVAYVPGVSDVVAPALRELGVDVTVIEPAALATADLSPYTTVVVGPRAYEAHPEVFAQRERLLDFARAGGTLVVQYQQYEVQRPGVVPYPMTVARPHDRVTMEAAPVTVVDAASPLLRGPNAIGAADWDGWVQERSLYMPRTFDERYAAPLEMHDPGEDPRRGALLVAPLGEGTYVYTALSFFRQLPAGVPGAARLFVNLLAAGTP